MGASLDIKVRSARTTDGLVLPQQTVPALYFDCMLSRRKESVVPNNNNFFLFFSFFF